MPDALPMSVAGQNQYEPPNGRRYAQNGTPRHPLRSGGAVIAASICMIDMNESSAFHSEQRILEHVHQHAFLILFVFLACTQ